MWSKNYFFESRCFGNEPFPHKSTLLSKILCCLYTEKKVNILEIIFPCWPLAEERKPILSARRPSLVKIFLSDTALIAHLGTLTTHNSSLPMTITTSTQLIKKIRGQKVFLCKQTSLQTWNKTFSVLLLSLGKFSTKPQQQV